MLLHTYYGCAKISHLLLIAWYGIHKLSLFISSQSLRYVLSFLLKECVFHYERHLILDRDQNRLVEYRICYELIKLVRSP